MMLNCGVRFCTSLYSTSMLALAPFCRLPDGVMVGCGVRVCASLYSILLSAIAPFCRLLDGVTVGVEPLGGVSGIMSDSDEILMSFFGLGCFLEWVPSAICWSLSGVPLFLMM